MTRYRVNNTQAEAKIAKEEAFRTSEADLPGRPGVIRFRAATGGAQSFGLLPERYRDDVRRARYVVYSYQTPIGWVRQDGTKTVPDVGYSLSTGQHQLIVQHAWGLRSFPARGREVVSPPSTHVQYGRERRLRSGGMDGHGETVQEHVDSSPDAARWFPGRDQS
jgi:hypothetical protein